MALTKGENSYVTVVEADAYFANRLDSDLWDETDDTDKAKALVTATGILDEKAWVGTIVDSEQSLAFPRTGWYKDPKQGMVVELPEDVPQRILKATYELAYHLLNNEGLQDSTGSVTDIEVGPIKLKNIKNVEKNSPAVYRLISPLLANGGRAWWRAN
jgi:hypothetical protein